MLRLTLCALALLSALAGAAQAQGPQPQGPSRFFGTVGVGTEHAAQSIVLYGLEARLGYQTNSGLTVSAITFGGQQDGYIGGDVSAARHSLEVGYVYEPTLALRPFLAPRFEASAGPAVFFAERLNQAGTYTIPALAARLSAEAVVFELVSFRWNLVGALNTELPSYGSAFSFGLNVPLARRQR